MTEPVKPEPRKLTTAEEKAQVRRDNAFRDLAAIVNKIQGPLLATGPMVLLAPGDRGQPVNAQVIVHVNPGAVSELLATLLHKNKQLELALNVLTTMILEKDLVNLEDFMTHCAEAAEENEKVMTRGLLSQGAAAQSIIRRN